MYCWSVASQFFAVAQATSVAQARKIMLKEIDASLRKDQTPELNKAARHVVAKSPSIWNGANAEFALTDSAALQEADAYSEQLNKKLLKVNKLADALAEDLRMAIRKNSLFPIIDSYALTAYDEFKSGKL